jgi:iron complex outermembrane receptor protein
LKKLALFVSAALSFAMLNGQASPARAADAPADNRGDTVAEVVVTSSRVKGETPVGSALLTISRAEIERSNATTTSQLFLNMPQVNNLGVSESLRSGNGGSANFNYSQGINIHAIGPYATLLLIDGQRAAPQGVYGLAVDTSIVPAIALQRVEVVPDGASAIYGSDAVAGVANLILRRSMDGAQVSANYGGGKDYDQYQFGAIAGRSWSSGHATLTYAYGGHSALKASDRSFARADLTGRGGSDFRSTQCNPGTVVIGGVNYAIPAGGVTPATAGLLLPNTTNRCDNFRSSYLLPKIERHNVVATVDQDVTQNLRLFGTGIYARREVDMRVGFLPTTLTVPTTNAFYVRPPGTGTAPETIRYALSELTDLPFSRGVAEFFQGTAGARLALPADWEATATVTYGSGQDVSRVDHAANNAALNAAVASSNPATALNPYGAPNSAAVLAAIGNGLSAFQGRSDQDVEEVSLTGPLFILPGGKVKLAVGYQHQRTKQESYNLTGTNTAPISALAVDFSRTVDSAYAELFVPLVGPDNAVPGVQSLQVDLAGRYDKYSDVGSTTNPKVGVNWEVVEGVRLHASYGTSFRAPPIFQARGAGNSFVTALSDPLAGGAPVTAIVTGGGNPDAKPETATTYSAGIDVTPGQIPGFTAQLNYFNVTYRNTLTALGNNAQILNQAYYSGLGIITRNPTPAQMAAILAKYPLIGGVLPATVPVYIDARTRNLASIKAEGLDLALNYHWETADYGAFDAGVVGSYFLKYDSTAAPGAPVVDLSGTILNPPDLQLKPYLSWRRGAADARVAVNFTDSYTNNLVTPVQKVSSNSTVDLHLGYDLGDLAKGVRIALDITNVFDRDPPFVNIGPSSTTDGGYDASLANPVGRLLAFTLTADF